ncbi:hemin uptake protein HemP [Massilia sp. W12]|uniref:hemin uptake protein HemP n=1 Tax=Massilia sp. W12 TaxID=3126507 RepID=UPI0030D566D0
MTTNTPAFKPQAAKPAVTLPRIKSSDLFQTNREIEIDHEGRIYRMRLTNLNKLILTA